MKKPLFPLLLRHLGCVCFVSCIVLLASCTKTNDEPADGKNVYRASYYLLELPEGFSVDSSESNSEWNVRYVKDALGNRVMSFFDRSFAKPVLKYNEECRAKNFMELARTDSVAIINGAATAHRTVVLFVNRQFAKQRGRSPLFVEFRYRPDIVDSVICEKIISSAKVRK